MQDVVVQAAVLIHASRPAVWAALVAPDTMTKITMVDEVLSPWRLGERFVWTCELAGQRTLVEGVVHRIDPDARLAYEFVDPHTRMFLGQENIHQVVISLEDEGEGTRVTVTQDNNLGEVAHKHAEGGWRLALHNLKALVERS